MAIINKDLDQLADRLIDQGWEVRATKGGHLRFVSPEGKSVFGPSTPSDHRAIRNLKAKLRRHGADI